MKTGTEVIRHAMRLLGYTNQYGEIDSAQFAETQKRGAAAVIQIYRDLKALENPSDETEYINMSEDIPLSYRAVNDVMPYGVAMVLAQGDGNSDGYAWFASVYNSKRKAAVSQPKRIVDVLPRGGY